ncbi:M56 family metallopeptidase [Proteiniphilum acetatigenes]|uniref:M56 family metallopeptidase n=1 Tax=Proteiniphilum acetatigenes TaxID=294710 RepID=UPI000377883B|nr:M56 family metallopeptidase [Proteiniphilum acetatigenes]SFK33936.1 TonB family C-terminal domain-containing protein [Porphyromonadaceae bacterium KH3CP3RA]
MSLFFIYLIQVNIALSLFYLLYAIVLKRDTFLRLRRLFFLSVIVFSLLYPFFTIPGLSDIWTSRSSDFQETTATVIIGEPGMAMVVEGEAVAPVAIPWEKILSLFYIAVTLAFLLRFVFQLLSIYGIWTKSEKQIISGIPVYQLKSNITPFSFFSLIFIHTEKHSETELSQILLHEQTHVRQWHSIDIMLVELLYLFSWWNPFVWLLKREMAMNLEYLADNGVLREGIDSREYQYHLLRLTYHETAVQIVNNFNVSQLKQRIMMMNKAKTPALQLVKYVLVVPIFFLFVMANSMYAAENGDKSMAGNNLPEPPPQKKGEAEELFIVAESQPEFPGGETAMMKFLADNIRYPVIAQENGIQGRVVCDFTIMKDGSISNVNILQGVDPALDAEVKRLISSMPKWKPGNQRGNVVNVRGVFPVVFRLQWDNPEDDPLTSEEKSNLFKSDLLDDLKEVEGMMILEEVVVVGYGMAEQK